MIRKLISQLRYIKSWKNAWRLLTRPIKSIELAITYRCNQKCPGCYVGTLREDITMSYEDACKNIDKYNPAAINVTGGEPLLHKDIYKIIHYGYSKGIIMSMVTNGSLLTEEILQRLANSGLNTLQISYGKNYSMRNIEWAEKASKYMNVCLSITNTKQNRGWNSDALLYANSINKNVQVLFNLPSGELEKDFDKEFYFQFRNLPCIREDNLYWAYNLIELLLGLNKGRCPAGVQKIYVTARGELTPCDRLHDKYNSYEEMSKVYKAKKKVWCNRLGDIQK